VAVEQIRSQEEAQEAALRPIAPELTTLISVAGEHHCQEQHREASNLRQLWRESMTSTPVPAIAAIIAEGLFKTPPFTFADVVASLSPSTRTIGRTASTSTAQNELLPLSSLAQHEVDLLGLQPHH
jgi:hypothetical protein